LIHAQASKLMDTRNMYIALYDEPIDTVSFGLALEDGERMEVGQGAWALRAAGKGATEAIIRSKEPLLFRTAKDAREWYARPENKEYTGYIPERFGYLGVPMMVGERVLGVIAVRNHEADNVYDQDDLITLSTIASQAAIALDNARMYYDVNRRLESLAEIGRVLTSGIGLQEDEILELIYSRATKLMDTDNMYIALYDEPTDTVRFGLAMMNGKRVDVEREKEWQPRRAGKGKTEEIIRTKKPLFHATKVEAEAWYAQPQHEEYVGAALPSWIGVPMTVGEKVLGVIATYHPTRDYVYSGDDLTMLQAMASQAAIALDNATLLRQTARRTEQLRTVQEITNAIQIHEELPAFLESILELSLPRLDAKAGTIQLLDRTSNELVIQAVIGPIAEKQKYERVPLSKGITGQTAREKRTIYVPDVTESNVYLPYLAETRSEIAAPLMIGEEVIGVFNLEDPRPDAFDEEKQELFELICAQVAIAIQEKMRLEEEQRKRIESEKDALLGKLTADIAHHVKNKVGLVRLAAINLLNDPTIAESPSRCKEVEKILRNAEATGKLAKDLFEPYREAEPERVNVDWLIQDAVISVEVPDDVELTKDISRDLPQVVIDRQGTVNVFQELLINALRAVREGEEPRWVKISSRLSGDGYVELLFSNSGPPIPQERWEAIFEQFVVVDERIGREEGFGLGLWSARAFLKGQGGDIRVLESDDVKTTFIVRLPVAPQKEG
jgi:GAF domain-containing protein